MTPRCKLTPTCERLPGHEGRCSRWLVVVDAARKQGGRVVDWLANKAIDALGGASK